jgi:histidinol-phosphate phosphatase family protein
VKPVIFLDRDGTLMEDRHYVRDPEEVVLFPDAVHALKIMKQKGYPIWMVSNQSGIGRGIMTHAQLQSVHDRFYSLLGKDGILPDGFSYCYHSPEELCGCRKPAPGLIQQAFPGLQIDWEKSYIIGDQKADLLLGLAIGATPCLVLTGKGEVTHRSISQESEFSSVQVFKNLMEFSTGLPSVVALSSGLE